MRKFVFFIITFSMFIIVSGCNKEPVYEFIDQVEVPVFTSVEDVNFPELILTSGNLSSLKLNYDLSEVNFDVVGDYKVEINYTENNKKKSKDIIINIVDDVSPVITGIQTTRAFEVGSEAPDWLEGINVSDNYDGNIILTSDDIDLSNVNMDVLGTFDVTYTVTDSSGNQTITIVTVTIDTIDRTAPTIEGEDTYTLEVGTSNFNWLSLITVSDNQDTNIQLTESNVDVTNLDTNELGTYDIVYTVSDSTGNTATKTIIATVVDSQGPVITGLENLSFLVGSSAPDWLDGLTVTDVYDGNISLTLDNLDLSKVNMDVVGSFEVIYTVEDQTGNETLEKITVSIVDSEDPVIIGTDTYTLEVSTTDFNWLSLITVIDNYDTELLLNEDNVDLTNLNVNVLGTYDVIYTVTDSNGNTASKTIEVNVVDTQKPVLTGEDTYTLEVKTTDFNWLSLITAIDNYDTVLLLTEDNVDLTNLNVNVLGTYDVIYTVTDSSGNTASKVIEVNVVDTQKPVITGEDTYTLEVKTTDFNWLSLITIIDNYDTKLLLTEENVDLTNLNVHVLGTYDVIYTVTDSSGNTASKTIEVNVVDTQKPVLTGEDTYTLEVKTTDFNWLSLITAIDNYDTVLLLTEDNVDLTNLNVNVLGTYDVTYTVTDSSGNTASKVIEVNVVDTQKPVITGEDTYTLEVKTTDFNWLSLITIIDNYDTELLLTEENVNLTNLNVHVLGTYDVIYTVTDSSGNVEYKTIVITVVDTTVPTIELIGDENIEIEYLGVYIDLGATGSDNYDDLIDIQVDYTSVNTTEIGTYYVTYNAIDASNNHAVEVTRVVKVVDTTAPNISLNGESEITICLLETYNELGATSEDIHDGSNEVVIDSTLIQNDVVGTYLVSYYSIDHAGNETTIYRTVHVVDIISPIVSYNSEITSFEIEVFTDYPNLLDYINVSDNYYDDFRYEIISDDFTNTVLGVYTVTVYVYDGSDNYSTINFSVTVQDTTPPVVTLIGNPYSLLGFNIVDPLTLVQVVDIYDSNVANNLSVDIYDSENNLVSDLSQLGEYVLSYFVVDSENNVTTFDVNFSVKEVGYYLDHLQEGFFDPEDAFVSQEIIRDVEQYPNSQKLILAVNDYPYSDSHIYMYEQNGTLMWHYQTYLKRAIYDLKVLDNGNILVIGINEDTSKLYLQIINELGVSVSEQEVGLDMATRINKITYDTDGYIYITGIKQYPDGFFIKIDQGGNVIWDNSNYLENTNYEMKDISIVGNYVYTTGYTNSIYDYNGFVKIFSKNGALLLSKDFPEIKIFSMITYNSKFYLATEDGLNIFDQQFNQINSIEYGGQFDNVQITVEDNNLYLYGVCSSNCEQFTESGEHERGIVLLKYDFTSNAFVWNGFIKMQYPYYLRLINHNGIFNLMGRGVIESSYQGFLFEFDKSKYIEVYGFEPTFIESHTAFDPLSDVSIKQLDLDVTISDIYNPVDTSVPGEYEVRYGFEIDESYYYISRTIIVTDGGDVPNIQVTDAEEIILTLQSVDNFTLDFQVIDTEDGDITDQAIVSGVINNAVGEYYITITVADSDFNYVSITKKIVVVDVITQYSNIHFTDLSGVVLDSTKLTNGNIVLVGYILTSDGNKNPWIAVVDANYNIISETEYVESNNNGQFQAVTDNGTNYYVSGIFDSDILNNFNFSDEETQGFATVLGFDYAGNAILPPNHLFIQLEYIGYVRIKSNEIADVLLTNTNLYISMKDQSETMSVRIDKFIIDGFTLTSDGIIVVGEISKYYGYPNFVGGNYDAMVRKYDFNGNIMWESILGTTSDENFYNVEIINNKIFAFGYSDYYGLLEGTQLKGDGILAVYDLDGNLENIYTNAQDYSECILMGGIPLEQSYLLYGQIKYGYGSSVYLLKENGTIDFKYEIPIEKVDISNVDAFDDEYIIIGNYYYDNGDWIYRDSSYIANLYYLDISYNLFGSYNKDTFTIDQYVEVKLTGTSISYNYEVVDSVVTDTSGTYTYKINIKGLEVYDVITVYFS